eukprot:Nk52_evm76s226 gene=Nk52_evmTU76s226
MSTGVEELKDALQEALESRGSLDKLKARIRAEIFCALDEHSDPKPKLSNENLVMNELIREYLEYNKYNYAASVLMAESGQPQQKLGREFIGEELNLTEDPKNKNIPLLYSLLSHFMNKGSTTTSQPRTFGKENVEVPVAPSISERKKTDEGFAADSDRKYCEKKTNQKYVKQQQKSSNPCID